MKIKNANKLLPHIYPKPATGIYICWLLFLIFFVLSCRSSKKSVSAFNNITPDTTLKVKNSGNTVNSLLWEITGNKLKDTSYLYGTMHIGDKRIFNFSDSLQYAFKRSNAYAGEIVLDKAAKKSAAGQIMMAGDTTLIMLVGESNFKLIRQRVRKKLPVFAGMVNRIKPIFTIGLISHEHFNNEKGTTLDEYFQKLAKKQNKAVLGLESVKEQLNALDRISYKEQAEMLLEELNSTGDEIQREADSMLDLYLKQDITALIESIPEDSISGNFNDFIINDRNTKMADRIAVLAANQPLFIAIGAAHLGGEKGVIALLKQKGFTMRPVFSPLKKD